jgi:adenylate cyclase
MLRISRKEIAVLAADKAPAQSMPRILEFGLALDGFSISKISDRVIAANREPRLIAPRRAGEEGHEQERDKPQARSKKTDRLHVFLRTTLSVNVSVAMRYKIDNMLPSAAKSTALRPMTNILELRGRKRKLAAILHADVVSFSRLMGFDEAGTHRALGELRRAVDPLIASHGGRIVGTAGDSMLADFSSVVDALSCAVEIQLAARAINDPIPPDRRLELRIGVNLGDVIVDGDDIFGDGVNIAARLQALALPGAVCISHSVYEQVRNKLDLDYHPLGSHRVKNIAEPVRAYMVGAPAVPGRAGKQRRLLAAAGACGLVAAGLVTWTLYTGAGRDLLGLAAPKPVEVAGLAEPHRLAGRPSVAVLPFKNLSTDAGQDFLSAGITEDVITALGRFSNLLVLAQSASFQLKDRNLSPVEIGRLLEVRYLLEGTVRRAGDRLRVNVELTEAATARNVWSEAYDAEVKDIFDVQEDIARRVVGAAAVKLTRFERDRALAKPTESLAAYEYVLRGREVPGSRATRDSNDEAQDMFQRAIDLDPSYAAAYAELGLTLIEAVGSGWTEFVADDLARAETLAQKALSLDSASTTAYRLLAEVHLARGRFDLALGQIDRALEINPSDAESFSMRGEILVWEGRSAEAVRWLEGALRFDNANARATFLLGTAYYFLDRYIESVEALDHALAGNLGRNTQVTGRSVLAAAYAELDRRPDAERERSAVMRMAPFLDAERFASQFGTQAAHDHMLEGLKKAGFH